MKRKNRNVNFITIMLCALCMITAVTVISAEPAFALGKTVFESSQVTGVKVTSVDYQTVCVSWKRLSGASGYEIYASNFRFAKYHRVARVKKGSTQTIDISSCETGKTYYFKVRAYRTSDTAVLQSEDSAVTKGRALLGKTTAKLKPVAHTMWVTWKTVPGASGYQIYRAKVNKKTLKIGEYQAVKTIPKKSATLWVDTTGLKGATKYYYKVRAYRGKDPESNGKYRDSAPKAKITPLKDGNAVKYDVHKLNPSADRSLDGLNIIYLGSSVTLGKYSNNQSFADMLEEVYGVGMTKEAVNGTTLANINRSSYVSRLQKDVSVDPNNPPNYLVCQLSTNDARLGVPLGSPAGRDKAYDPTTVAGAIEYITAYAEVNLHCPVIFYIVPEFDSSYANDGGYQKMISLLYDIQKGWPDQLLILDLWNDPEYRKLYENDDEVKHQFHMIDAVHPSKAGYYQIYLPAFADFLKKLQPETPADDGTETETETTDTGVTETGVTETGVTETGVTVMGVPEDMVTGEPVAFVSDDHVPEM